MYALHGIWLRSKFILYIGVSSEIINGIHGFHDLNKQNIQKWTNQ